MRTKKDWISIAVAGAVVLAGGTATPFVVGHFQTESRISDAHASVTALEDAQSAYDSAVKEYVEALEAGHAYSAQPAGLIPKIDAAPALFTEETITDYKAAVEDYQKLVEPTSEETTTDDDGNEVTAPVFGPFTSPVSKPVTEKDLLAATDKPDEFTKLDETIDGQTEKVNDATAKIKDKTAKLAEAQTTIEETLAALAASTDGLGHEYIAATFPKAEHAPKELFAATFATVLTVGDGTFETTEAVEADEEKGIEAAPAKTIYTAVNAYLDAFKGVSDSNAAVIAAEEEAARQAAEEAERQRNNNGGSNGNWNNGNSDGNRGSSGGSNNGGSSNGGGSNNGGSSNNGGGNEVGPRGTIVKGGSSCSSATGGASGNWSSNLVYPSNAHNVWVASENPGVSWSIGWDCTDPNGW